jgi:hypothetical protein
MQQLQQCQQMIALDERLATILKGGPNPTNENEQLNLALLCQNYKRRYANATRFYADAFAADPKLTDNPAAGHRYDAARAAVLAAVQGMDAGRLEDKERARLRKQALDWLRADLDLWAKQVENGKPPVRDAVRQTLQRWQKEMDLVTLRDVLALAELPEAEGVACLKLWADVAALVKKCAEKDKP